MAQPQISSNGEGVAFQRFATSQPVDMLSPKGSPSLSRPRMRRNIERRRAVQRRVLTTEPTVIVQGRLWKKEAMTMVMKMKMMKIILTQHLSRCHTVRNPWCPLLSSSYLQDTYSCDQFPAFSVRKKMYKLKRLLYSIACYCYLQSSKKVES